MVPLVGVTSLQSWLASGTDSSLMTDGRIQLSRFHVPLREVLLEKRK